MPKNSPRQPQVSTPQIQHAWSLNPNIFNNPNNHHIKININHSNHSNSSNLVLISLSKINHQRLNYHLISNNNFLSTSTTWSRTTTTKWRTTSFTNESSTNESCRRSPYAMGPGGPNNSAPGYYNYVSVPGGAQNLQYSSPNWRR